MTWLTSFTRDERGVAALEGAMIGSILVGALFNVVEVSRYAYITTQVAAASQAGAQAAIVTCDTVKTPVTINCPAAPAAIELAVHGTSLGGAVEQATALQEGWYCLDLSGVLQLMSAANAKPTDCTAAGVPGGLPSLYLQVRVAYEFSPIFPGLTLTEAFPSTIARTAWMRML